MSPRPRSLKALGTVAAGTVVVWRNGLYGDQVAELKSAGTAENPVVLRAEKPGAVCFTGTSRISVSGTYAEVNGFWWRNPEPVSGKAVVTLAKGSSHCTVRDCAVTGDSTKEDAETDTKWVSLYGTDHRVEGCTFRDKRNIGTLLVVWLETGVTPRHTIAGNRFERPVTLYDDNNKAINGQETIRIGTSDYSMQEAACTVETTTSTIATANRPRSCRTSRAATLPPQPLCRVPGDADHAPRQQLHRYGELLRRKRHVRNGRHPADRRGPCRRTQLPRRAGRNGLPFGDLPGPRAGEPGTERLLAGEGMPRCATTWSTTASTG